MKTVLHFVVIFGFVYWGYVEAATPPNALSGRGDASISIRDVFKKMTAIFTTCKAVESTNVLLNCTKTEKKVTTVLDCTGKLNLGTKVTMKCMPGFATKDKHKFITCVKGRKYNKPVITCSQQVTTASTTSAETTTEASTEVKIESVTEPSADTSSVDAATDPASQSADTTTAAAVDASATAALTTAATLTPSGTNTTNTTNTSTLTDRNTFSNNTTAMSNLNTDSATNTTTNTTSNPISTASQTIWTNDSATTIGSTTSMTTATTTTTIPVASTLIPVTTADATTLTVPTTTTDLIALTTPTLPTTTTVATTTTTTVATTTTTTTTKTTLTTPTTTPIETTTLSPSYVLVPNVGNVKYYVPTRSASGASLSCVADGAKLFAITTVARQEFAIAFIKSFMTMNSSFTPQIYLGVTRTGTTWKTSTGILVSTLPVFKWAPSHPANINDCVLYVGSTMLTHERNCADHTRLLSYICEKP